MLATDSRSELFEQIIPGTFIIRSSCTAIREREKANTVVIQAKKNAVVALINSVQPGAAAHLVNKRGYALERHGLSACVKRARDVGACEVALAQAAGLAHPSPHPQGVGEKRKR